MRIENFFRDVTLTPSQQFVLQQLEEFFKNPEKNVFILRGYAGTGKTFLTLGVTRFLQDQGTPFHLVAPTGKAAKVLKRKSRQDASTIHRLIYQSKDIRTFHQDEILETGTYRFYVPIRTNIDSSRTVYIVDESSMVSDLLSDDEFLVFGTGKVLTDFLNYVNIDHNDHAKKIIFIGDDAQLPPVGMNFSPALNKEYLKKKFGVKVEEASLNDIVRQKKDSEILKNSLSMRKGLEAGKFNTLKFNLKQGEVEDLEPKDVADKYENFSDFQQIECDQEISKCAVIAYTNQSVLKYNQIIRERIFGENPREIEEGDLLLVYQNNVHYGLMNGDILRVMENTGDVWSRQITLKNKNETTGQVTEKKVVLTYRRIKVVTEDLSELYCTICESFLCSQNSSPLSEENRAAYVSFCMRNPRLRRDSEEFKQQLFQDEEFNALKVKYGFAMTCHKAQGSQWPTVIVDCSYGGNKRTAFYFRWLYTAITRASERLFLINRPEFTAFSSMSYQRNLIPAHPGSTPTKRITTETSHNQNTYTATPSSQTISKITTTQQMSPDTFGITEDFPFLLNLFRRICETIEPDVSIRDVIHHNYQETYVFEKNRELIKITFFYNGKEELTKIQPNGLTPNTASLTKSLKKLIGLSGKENLPRESSTSFGSDFLDDFDSKLRETAQSLGIEIRNCRQLPYALRYTFVNGNETAVFDFFYNSKESFTKVRPVKIPSTDMNTILEELISQLIDS